MSWTVERGLYLEAEKAAAIPDPEERRRALDAIDERWPRAKPTDDLPHLFGRFEDVNHSERSYLARVKAVLAIEEAFARDGRAPREWTLPPGRESDRVWFYQPRDDGQGYRVGFLFLDSPGPRIVTLFER